MAREEGERERRTSVSRATARLLRGEREKKKG
jgi:hypothetical protein